MTVEDFTGLFPAIASEAVRPGSSTARQIGNTAEPGRRMICVEPRATLAVELLAERSRRVIPFVAPAPLQLGHDHIHKIGEGLRHHRVG